MWGILEIVVSDLEEENKKHQGGFLPDMHSILTHTAEQNTTQHIWNIQAFSHTQSWHDLNLNEKHLDTILSVLIPEMDYYVIQNEISVIISSPSRCSRHVWLSFFCWKQRRRMLQLTVTIDLHIMGEKFNERRWVPSTFSKFGCQYFFCVCVQQKKDSYMFGMTWG